MTQLAEFLIIKVDCNVLGRSKGVLRARAHIGTAAQTRDQGLNKNSKSKYAFLKQYTYFHIALDANWRELANSPSTFAPSPSHFLTVMSDVPTASIRAAPN